MVLFTTCVTLHVKISLDQVVSAIIKYLVYKSATSSNLSKRLMHMVSFIGLTPHLGRF
jgi:hypothetical protein